MGWEVRLESSLRLLIPRLGKWYQLVVEILFHLLGGVGGITIQASYVPFLQHAPIVPTDRTGDSGLVLFVLEHELENVGQTPDAWCIHEEHCVKVRFVQRNDLLDEMVPNSNKRGDTLCRSDTRPLPFL